MSKTKRFVKLIKRDLVATGRFVRKAFDFIPLMTLLLLPMLIGALLTTLTNNLWCFTIGTLVNPIYVWLLIRWVEAGEGEP